MRSTDQYHPKKAIVQEIITMSSNWTGLMLVEFNLLVILICDKLFSGGNA